MGLFQNMALRNLEDNILAKAHDEFQYLCPPSKDGGNSDGGNSNGSNSDGSNFLNRNGL